MNPHVMAEYRVPPPSFAGVLTARKLGFLWVVHLGNEAHSGVASDAYLDANSLGQSRA